MGFFGDKQQATATADRPGPAASAYERHKAGAAKRQASLSAAGREIGPLPSPEDPGRRAACEFDFRLYCETYRKPKFRLGWSPSHLDLIEALQRAVLEGILRAIGFPRGTGKTTLCESAVEWAVMYGHRRLAVLIAAEEGKAEDSLSSIKKNCETNPLLLADFPEIIVPIRRLGRTPQRARGQTHNGLPTFIEWGQNEICLPYIEGSKASGACIAVAGLQSSHIRGVKRTLPNGEEVRPDIALVDDMQTRLTAVSPMACRRRIQTILGDVLGMAGPGETLSVLVPCTVIYKGDAADQLLDRTLHPRFRGLRMKLMPSMPEKLDLWRQYWDLRCTEMREDDDRATTPCPKSNAFYAEHREEMDRGAVVMWEDRYEKNELSAVQNCMNLYLASPETFASEFQNEPIADAPQEAEALDAADVTKRINHVPRRVAPKGFEVLTAQIDVHDRLLFYAVAAWREGFGGGVIEHSTYPEQPTPIFTLANCPRPLSEVYPDLATEVAVETALAKLIDTLMSRQWQREDSEEPSRIGLLLIDEGYEADMVRRVIRRSQYRDRIRPSKGVGIGAHQTPMTDWKARDGEKAGLNWRRKPLPGTTQEGVIFDTHFWKSFARNRLTAAPRAADALTLYGDDPHAHALLGDHVAAEYPTTTEGKGRVVEVWQLKPGQRDNHKWDNIVGCTVGASILGIALPSPVAAAPPAARRRRRRVISKWGKR